MSRYYFPIQNGKQIISTYSGIKGIADYALYGLGNKNAKDVSFPDLENVSGRFALYKSFSSSEMLETISFPKLETIDGYRSLYQCFSGCSNLQSIAFQELKTLAAAEAMYQAFSSCSQLGSVNFSKLETVIGSFSMYGAFSFCTSLITISFPQLTSVGDNSFRSCFYGCTNLTAIHFRSDMRSTLENKNDWGVSNSIFVFDL